MVLNSGRSSVLNSQNSPNFERTQRQQRLTLVRDAQAMTDMNNQRRKKNNDRDIEVDDDDDDGSSEMEEDDSSILCVGCDWEILTAALTLELILNDATHNTNKVGAKYSMNVGQDGHNNTVTILRSFLSWETRINYDIFWIVCMPLFYGKNVDSIEMVITDGNNEVCEAVARAIKDKFIGGDPYIVEIKYLNNVAYLICKCSKYRIDLIPCSHTLCVNNGEVSITDVHFRYYNIYYTGVCDSLIKYRSKRDFGVGPTCKDPVLEWAKENNKKKCNRFEDEDQLDNDSHLTDEESKDRDEPIINTDAGGFVGDFSDNDNSDNTVYNEDSTEELTDFFIQVLSDQMRGDIDLMNTYKNNPRDATDFYNTCLATITSNVTKYQNHTYYRNTFLSGLRNFCYSFEEMARNTSAKDPVEGTYIEDAVFKDDGTENNNRVPQLWERFQRRKQNRK
eukprot:Pgem_evm1s19503